MTDQNNQPQQPISSTNQQTSNVTQTMQVMRNVQQNIESRPAENQTSISDGNGGRITMNDHQINTKR